MRCDESERAQKKTAREIASATQHNSLKSKIDDLIGKLCRTSRPHNHHSASTASVSI